ncbi:MAG: ABC transporter ATP-binding protein [Candidatus Saganbacteria bacterium]|nr:ABC transporter ATP-binding protein [Candidatus Saganbacteria bacterium]
MKLYTRLLNFLKPYTSPLASGLFCTLIVTLCTLCVAPLVGTLFKAIETQDFKLLNWGALAIVGLLFIKGFFQYGQTYWNTYISQRVITDLRKKCFSHLQDLSLDFYAHWHSGELISRIMNDISTLQGVLIGSFTVIIPQAILIIGLIGYLFFLNWKLTLMTLIGLPLILQALRVFGKKIGEISERIQQKAADLTSLLQETIAGARVVKSFTMEKEEIKKFSHEAENAFEVSMRATQVQATQSPVIALLQTSAVIIIAWFGGAEVIRGGLTVPQLISFITALAVMTDPALALSNAYTSAHGAMASAKRIFEILDAPVKIQDAPFAKELPTLKGEVEFKNVFFAYGDKDIAALKNVSLKVKPGEVIALVGRTGAGKSTFINLLPRFYEISNGNILVDGYNIKTVTIRSLRKQIGIVPQESMLFSGSLKENIAYGKPNATQAEIEDAAKLANIHNFITGLPDGYETKSGERGVRLSGGERQRIAIARAILRDPRILILDEATSSLDSETEQLIQEALERLMQSRTTFIIAHRLSTVEHANRIVVLDKGEITEIGSHDELMAHDGIYKKLYSIQFGIEDNA